MNSRLVLLKLHVKLIFCHISHNGILFAVSFRAVNFWIQEFKSCPESLVAFLIMEPSVLFHSKLWMLNWWTNWIFCLISHNGIFIKSYLSAWIPGGFVWIFDLYEFQYGYEFKSCPFKVRCQIESFVTYLTMESCLLFHSKLWIFKKNSSLVFKSQCQIESLFTYLTMKSCMLFHSKQWYFY